MPFILAWVSMATPMLCQSEEWGSGWDAFALMTTNNITQAAGDEPDRKSDNHDWFTSVAFSSQSSAMLQHEHQLDRCSVHFSTSSRRLKAEKEHLAYMQTVQHGNRAVMDNLLQFVDSELGDQRYEDVIKENIISIQEEHKTCHEVVEKAEDDMQERLEGEATAMLTGMKKWDKSFIPKFALWIFYLLYPALCSICTFFCWTTSPPEQNQGSVQNFWRHAWCSNRHCRPTGDLFQGPASHFHQAAERHHKNSALRRCSSISAWQIQIFFQTDTQIANRGSATSADCKAKSLSMPWLWLFTPHSEIHKTEHTKQL